MDSIVLSKKDFKSLKDLIYSSSGIHLHEGKIELLKSKLAKRMRLTKKSYSDYLSYLHSTQREVIEFIDTVTTNHSFFFRENNSIEHIINQFKQYPKLHTKEFKIWCAACSTGDEPYSVAVQLKEAGLSFSILATDISHTVLDVAQKAVYRDNKTQKIPLSILHRYFQKGSGKYKGFVKVKPEIKKHIQFDKFNLINDAPPPLKFDAVLCRNVMIYFDLKTSESVVNKLYQVLNTNGYFAIGNAESLMNMKHNFNSVKKIPSLYIK
ncbi:MAG: protein-glutamate O-methyltransferase CheR [Desulfobacula sp.]|nr:protein-glutamate O-methyltransferase CheR [Desulfobacula sp.]